MVPPDPNSHPTDFEALSFLDRIHSDVSDARDNLLASKVDQARFANRDRRPDPPLSVGDKVMLSTKHRKNEFKRTGDNRAAKFFPRYDGPYTITKAFPDFSAYTLDLPSHLRIFPTFHISELKPYVPNDADLFPQRTHPQPGPVVTQDGIAEWEIDRIIDERPRGRGKQYLVRWKDYGRDSDSWLPGRELEECEALDRWEGVGS